MREGVEGMKIPERVRIGYREYDVNCRPGPVVVDNSVCYGSIEYEKGVININGNYPEDQKECTFLHECLHGIETDRDLNLSEKVVETLAKGLYCFIRDNPEMFEKDDNTTSHRGIRASYPDDR